MKSLPSNIYSDYKTKKIDPKIDIDMNLIDKKARETYKKIFGIFPVPLEKIESDFFVSGKAKLRSGFIIFFFVIFFSIARYSGELLLWLGGFTYTVDKYGFRHYKWKNKSKKNNGKCLMFFHGIFMGVSPNYFVLRNYFSYKEISAIEYPNIAYGEQVENLPTASDLVDAFINELKQINSKKIDMIGLSFGTNMMAQIINSKEYDKFKNRIENVIFLDPTCFLISVCNLISFTNVDSLEDSMHSNFFPISLKVKPEVIQPSYIGHTFVGTLSLFFKNSKYGTALLRAFLYLCIFNDLNLQELIARNTFFEESIIDMKKINKNTYFVLGNNDLFVDYKIILNDLCEEKGEQFILDNTVIINNGFHTLSLYDKNIVKYYKEKFNLK
jgi:hypothetical protein